MGFRFLVHSVEESRPSFVLRKFVMDHIKPLKTVTRGGPIDRELLHFTNIQPIIKEDNMSKGYKWSDKDEEFWRKHILYKPDWDDICIPHPGGRGFRQTCIPSPGDSRPSDWTVDPLTSRVEMLPRLPDPTKMLVLSALVLY